jgi:DNA invertase Pin-like site-specific DNA recombinase
MISADLYLRLSDFRGDDDPDTFGKREKLLRAEADRLGWAVHRVVQENDLTAEGELKPASAYKRTRAHDRRTGEPLVDHRGRPVFKVDRPEWESILDDLYSGAASAVLAEDLDRVARDPQDLIYLLDAIASCRGHARSLSGSLNLTDGGTPDQRTIAHIMVTMAQKSSADTGRRVSSERKQQKIDGRYGGGRRPFGFTPDPAAPKKHKRLLQVPAEAAIIEYAAGALLAGNGDEKTLALIARELRNGAVVIDGSPLGMVPTATGVRWTAPVLRGVLLKEANAHPAWGVLTPDEYHVLCKKLRDPARRTNAGTAPRWLGSGLFKCGPCGTGLKVAGAAGRGLKYVCPNCYAVVRNATRTDEYVTEYLLARLSRPDAAVLLLPAEAVTADTPALRAEAKKLERGLSASARLVASGDLTEAEYRRAARDPKARLAAIAGQLAAATPADPLPEFRSGTDPREVWARLPLVRRRAVLRALLTVTLLPSSRRGPVGEPGVTEGPRTDHYDYDACRIEPAC